MATQRDGGRMSKFKRFKNPIYCPSSHHNGVPGIQNVIMAWVDSIEIAALEQANEKIKELEAKLTNYMLGFTIQTERCELLEAKLDKCEEQRNKYHSIAEMEGMTDFTIEELNTQLEKFRGENV